MSRGRIQISIGLGLLLFGVAAILSSEVGTLISIKRNYIIATGLIATLVGLHLARQWWKDQKSTVTPPAVETRIELPVPGVEFDERLEEINSTRLHRREYKQWCDQRNAIRDDLEVLLVATLADELALSKEEAKTAVEEDLWTDNPHAIAFMSGTYPSGEPIQNRMTKLAPWADLSAVKQAKETVRELGIIASGERKKVHKQLESGSTIDPTETAASETTRDSVPAIGDSQ